MVFVIEVEGFFSNLALCQLVSLQTDEVRTCLLLEVQQIFLIL